MKKLCALCLVALLALLPLVSLAEPTLTMGSWRTDDVVKMEALLATYKEVSGVDIAFQPTNPPDYNATLRMQLDAGTGPDLMYARSYATGTALFNDGYILDCSVIPGVLENFDDLARAPWRTPEGKQFAVPFAAVSHAVYYNKDLFAANNLEIPTTWEEFIAVCDAFKAAGITPLANGIADNWDILEVCFLSMLPNYIGGAAERVKYESGEKPLNDEAFVQAYTDFASLAQYLDPGFSAVTYNDSQIMFATGRAAMFMDGSWTCGTYGEAGFEWSVFAVPARAGSETRICFHNDTAITMNVATPYPEEAKAFLAWLASPEGATAAAKTLPDGFFSLFNPPVPPEEEHAQAILALNEGKETDVRFVWPAFMEQPALYNPMLEQCNALLKGETTPQAAADAINAIALPFFAK